MVIVQGWGMSEIGVSEGGCRKVRPCRLCGTCEALPETARAWSHGRRSAAFVPRNAFSAEVLGEEVQFIRRGLEGQLVQLLL